MSGAEFEGLLRAIIVPSRSSLLSPRRRLAQGHHLVHSPQLSCRPQQVGVSPTHWLNSQVEVADSETCLVSLSDDELNSIDTNSYKLWKEVRLSAQG